MLDRGEIFWCIWAGILVLLFLMSSTDLIIKEKKIEIHSIPVIIEGDNGDYYMSFKKGMGQAAVKFHGNVGFIILYAGHDQVQQMGLVKREIRDGTRVVILAPVKSEEAVRKLESTNPGCPVILLGQSPDEDTALGIISVGGREVGRLLGEAAASQASRDVPAYLFCGGLDHEDSTWVYKGVRAVLDERGYHYRFIKRKDQDIYRQATQETDIPGGGRITIITLDVQSLDQTIRILEENIIYQGRATGLYDAGDTTSLLRALDRRVVMGLTVYDQFGEGYLSVKQAVEATQGTHQRQNTVLEVICVDRDKLRDKVYEKMFYPIE